MEHNLVGAKDQKAKDHIVLPNTVAYKQLHACTGEYLIILEKWCSSPPKWIFFKSFFLKNKYS